MSILKLIALTSLLFSLPVFSATPKSICGRSDDRVPSFRNEIGRLSEKDEYEGCTVTLISPHCGLTAGHCKPVLYKAEFNTQPSRDGKPSPARYEDRYLIDLERSVMQNKGRKNDWAVIWLKNNEITNQAPGNIQGTFSVAYRTPRIGELVRITGYGRDESQGQRHFAQQTSLGRVVSVSRIGEHTISHNADTMGGNSGSTIISETTGKILGIHAYGGCNYNGANSGTLIANNPELLSAIKSCLDQDR